MRPLGEDAFGFGEPTGDALGEFRDRGEANAIVLVAFLRPEV